MKKQYETKIKQKVLKNTNGITLIALIITVIILLILAGVSISMIVGDNGILSQAGNAKKQTEEAKKKEEERLEIAEQLINNSDAELKNGKLQNIEIEMPTKIQYIKGEELDTDGMVVKAVYENGNKIDITNEVQVSGYNKKIAGTHTVTVSYAGKTATFEVTSEEIYTVKVDGVEYMKGVYNTPVTITAEEEKDGKQFSGWKNGNIVVSTDLTFKEYIAADMNLTKVYGESLEITPIATIANTILLKRADNKANVKFAVKLVVPTEYTLEEAGIFWTTIDKKELPFLHNENGEVIEGAKKKITPTVNRMYQFAVNLNGASEGKTVRGVAFAKIQKGNKVEWIFSEEKSVTYTND